MPRTVPAAVRFVNHGGARYADPMNALRAALMLAVSALPCAAQRVQELYQQHCAVCHGANLEGGLGGALTGAAWKHGGSDTDLARVITDGLPDLGMQSFRDTLTPDQIRALVVFIRERENQEGLRNAPSPIAKPGATVDTRLHRYRVELFAEGLDLPWSLAFLPDGSFLVTERPGALRTITPDGVVGPPIRNTPRVHHYGQGGMLEVALHPNFAENGWIYLAFAEGDQAEGRGRAMTAVVRGRIRGGAWTDEEHIWRADRRFYTQAAVHFGTRIAFDPAGFLYVVIGERGAWNEVQDLANPKGKILRLYDDGRIPGDNPFAGRADAIPGIWTYGHRNPQGLAFDPRTGDLWSTEHGPRGGDELNLILPGKNYGWPLVSHGIHYDGRPFTALTEHPDMESPVHHWTPSIAACGLAFYDGAAFPRWRGQLFAGALAQQEVRRIRLENRRVVEEEVILKNAGRVRDVRAGPDGLLYVVLNEPHRILRLHPADG